MAAVTAKLVVVAEVPVAVEKVKSVRVEEAVEMKPLRKARVVEVAFSPVPKVVNGNEAVPNPETESVPFVRTKFEPTMRPTKAPSGEA